MRSEIRSKSDEWRVTSNNLFFDNRIDFIWI
jgi:hypothetical protein